MKLKFLHKRKEEKQTEKEAFSLPKFIIERSRAIEIVFLVLVLISALMAPRWDSIWGKKCFRQRRRFGTYGTAPGGNIDTDGM